MVRGPVLVAIASALIASAAASSTAGAQADPSSIDLVVDAGRPLRVELDQRIRLQSVGQVVTGTVREPVYAYDRIVIPVGTRVRGHVSAIDSGSTFVRARAYMSGNLSPNKHAVLKFDTLLLDGGVEMPIDTIVKGGFPNVRRSVAGGNKPAPADGDGDAKQTLAQRGKSELRQRTTEAVDGAKQKFHDTLATIKSVREPGQLARLRDAAVQQLPYHPQYIAKGTVYDAELSTPISFGRAEPAEAAPAGTAPAPDSILTARLKETLDSSKTPRGARFQAVITEPVFSADHRVVLPEGTTLTGEVTLVRPARKYHRNGQLRFLFESVQVPNQPPAPLLGALHSVDASDDEHVALDDEGGATLENSKTRFVAPALSLLALHASIERDGHRYADPDGDGTIENAGSGAGSRFLGGFIGMGFLGAAVSQITRPVGIAMGAYGAARSMDTNVLGKGREVVFAADTPIQVRLAPGPSKND
jgi:hypothetical protein